MKHPYLVYLLVLGIFSFSCRNIEIKHINFLTEIWGDTANGRNWLNRDDYFIIYNPEDSSNLDETINKSIKPYIDSFSLKYSNYTIFLYKESKLADTLYIKKFDDGYYYKALLDEKPYKKMQWWGGRLLSK